MRLCRRSSFLQNFFQKKDQQDLTGRQGCCQAPVWCSVDRKENQMKTARVDDALKSGHITPADGNLFADLGFSPEQAEAMLKQADARIAKSQKLKKEAAMAIAQWIQSEKLTQFAASEILDVSRPRVSDLVNEKLGRFSLDMLVAMLLRTGKTVELVVH
jgi:predicted XRE-type DNA-binding protein